MPLAAGPPRPPGDLVRRRPPGDRRHRLSRRRGADLRSGDARQPDLVLRRPRRSIRTIPQRARQLLAAAGLADRNGDGMLDDAAGKPVRFSILTQKGHTLRERTRRVIQEQLRQVGHRGRRRRARRRDHCCEHWGKGDYDSIYFGVQASSTDPALNPILVERRSVPLLEPRRRRRPRPNGRRASTTLMRRQAASPPTLPERQQLFAEVQRIIGEELPAIYFVAPQVTIAVSPRVGNPPPVAAGAAAALERGDARCCAVLTRNGRPAIGRNIRCSPRCSGSCPPPGPRRPADRSSVSSAAMLLVHLAPGDALRAFDVDPAGRGRRARAARPRSSLRRAVRRLARRAGAARLRRVARSSAGRSRRCSRERVANTVLLGVAPRSCWRSALGIPAGVLTGSGAAALVVARHRAACRCCWSRRRRWSPRSAPADRRANRLAADRRARRRRRGRRSRDVAHCAALPVAAGARAGAADRRVARAAAVAGDARRRCGNRASRRRARAGSRSRRAIWIHAWRLSLPAGPRRARHRRRHRPQRLVRRRDRDVVARPRRPDVRRRCSARDLYLAAGCAAAGAAFLSIGVARRRHRARDCSIRGRCETA